MLIKDFSASEICSFIYELIFHNVYAADRISLERAIYNRFIGFRSELDFAVYHKSRNKSMLPGGFLLPVQKGAGSLEKPVYFTVTNEPVLHLTEIYRAIANLDNSGLFLLQPVADVKENRIIYEDCAAFPVCAYRIYRFENDLFNELHGGVELLQNLFRKKDVFNPHTISGSGSFKEKCINLISGYSIEDLVSIYCSRLVFDGFIGLQYQKGIPSDIDIVLVNEAGNYFFAEIKEKDISKTEPKGFGIDIRRLNDILQIQTKTSIPYYYIVREINNQKSRNFVTWSAISFSDFRKHAVFNFIKEGGVGMSTGSKSNPTVLVKREMFKNF